MTTHQGHNVGVQRIDSLDKLNGARVHLALGVFDGVHLGHQAVIAAAVEAARVAGELAGVVTFDPYPIRVLAPQKAPQRLLASLDHKQRILEPLGVDFLLVIPFDRAFAEISAESFVEMLCAGGAQTIAAGEDWRFGHRQGGDRKLLESMAGEMDFRFIPVPPVMLDGERISSTRIRQAVRDGNLAAAARMLGRPYTVAGRVIEGQKLGRQIGFPTANLQRGEEQYPPDGVWAVRVTLSGGAIQNGVANLGRRPTVQGGSRSLEVHLFADPGDLYGQVLEVEFAAHLRDEEKFDDVTALKNQIAEDVAKAKDCLSKILNPEGA